MNRNAIAVTAAVLALGGLVAGCDSGDETGHDAAVSKGRDDQARKVYNMPTKIPNFAVLCSLGNLVYENSRSNGGGYLVVLPHDAHCTGVADGGVPHA